MKAKYPKNQLTSVSAFEHYRDSKFQKFVFVGPGPNEQSAEEIPPFLFRLSIIQQFELYLGRILKLMKIGKNVM